jgi:hypothetical protein
MAEKAVSEKGMGVRLACQAFGISVNVDGHITLLYRPLKNNRLKFLARLFFSILAIYRCFCHRNGHKTMLSGMFGQITLLLTLKSTRDPKKTPISNMVWLDSLEIGENEGFSLLS